MYAENAERPNFLLITIDTLRRDRFGCYGSTAPSTPNLDAMAAKGVVFDYYFAPANCTVPSHLSMFSSKLPTTLNILDNEKYDVASRTKILPIYLQQLGYKTYGVASAFFFRQNWLAGFGSLFDSYVAPADGEFKAEQVTATFRKILPELKKGKFFCWLHFYDPHTPYDPPERYKKYYDVDGHGGIEVPGIEETINTAWMKSFGLNRTWQGRSRYRGEVAYVDEQIGEILRLLIANSLEKNTIIFIVADHGELLGDHGFYYTHHTLYEETIHVPFIVYGKAFRATHVSEFVSGVDVAPTILELAGAKIPEDLEGISAVPFLQGKNPSRDRLIYSVSANSDSIAILKPPFKMIFNKPTSELTEAFELYHITRDRHERHNRINSDPDVAASIRRRANPYLFDKRPATNWDPMSEQETEQLKALGYLQ